jgi:hypothetical protein
MRYQVPVTSVPDPMTVVVPPVICTPNFWLALTYRKMAIGFVVAPRIRKIDISPPGSDDG